MQFSKRLDRFGEEIFAALNNRRMELEQQGMKIYNMSVGKPDFKIIGDAFVFSYLRNSGAAWGMLSGRINLFLVFTVIVMLIVTYVIINLPATRKYMPLLITCTLLVSGAVGNFIDRVRFGYVRDFIYFKLINFPVFNVADCYVTVSVALLIILILFVYKEDDFGFLKLSKKGDNNE